MKSSPSPAGFDRSRRVVFDSAPELYDRARPSYPQQLIEDIVQFSGIPEDGQILEIGCGSGKATLPFAQRGYRMTCIELGANLAQFARQKFVAFEKVAVINSDFEEFTPQPGSYDLAISAQAFHWIHPGVGYPKCARALRPGGTLALFWNRTPEEENPVSAEFDAAYQKYAPHIASENSPRPLRDWEAIIRSEIQASGLFEEPGVHYYPWSCRYRKQAYLELLETFSDHTTLPDEAKARLYRAIGEIIEAHGGEIEKGYVAVLFISRVKK